MCCSDNSSISPRSIFSSSRLTMEARRCWIEMIGAVGSNVDGGSVLPLDSGTPVEREGSLYAADASKVRKDPSCSTGVPESKGGGTEPPSTFDPTTPIISIRHRLVSIVNRELDKMERREIDELSEQHNNMLHQLASLSVSSSASVTLSEVEVVRCLAHLVRASG